MTLEKGIASLVEEFIAAGRPSSREQSIDDRRNGYLASAVLAGEMETRVQVEDITLDGMTLRVVSPPKSNGLLPTIVYYHGGCFVSGGFATHDNQLRQLAWFSGCRVIAVQYRLAQSTLFRRRTMTQNEASTLSIGMRSSLALTPRASHWPATAPAGTLPWSRLCA
jgi:acetyl esterase